MDSYTTLIERTRIPQPSLQKLAVISLFEKFRSAPPSDAGRDALSRCLRSASPAVVDQSTRELCRLVKDSKLDVSTGLLELQSALEECSNPQFTSVFIKAIGLLTRLGFEENPSLFWFHSSQNHPFVKILSCRAEVQGELVKQVITFIMKCKHLGMEAVCEFLAPFLNYSIIKVPVSSSSAAFVGNLVSTTVAFCCSFPQEAIPIIKLLTGRLKFFSCKNAEEVNNVLCIFESLVDGYLVVLRQLVGMGLLVREAQLCGLALLEAILSQHRDFCKCSGGLEKILEVARNLLMVQKELCLNYVTKLSSVLLSLFPILTQSELEHEQYSILKLILFLLRWKSENEYSIGSSASELSTELLFIFPVLALVSSPSRSIKQTAADLLSVLGKIAASSLFSPNEKQVPEWVHQSPTTPADIVFRLLRNLWFEDQLPLHGSFYISHFSHGEVYANVDHCEQETWTSSVREYCLAIAGMQKSTSTICDFAEIFITEMPFIFCAVASVTLLHQKGNSAVDLLAIGSNIEPKLGVPLLLVILFYNQIFTSAEKYNNCHVMLKLLGLLPSVASHPAMIPLILQILLPMLHKDVNPVIKATATRLLCKTWEINDRVFESLQGTLHPNGLLQHEAERGVCISIAVSINDVCKRNPDRGVDIILSVEACIEHHDPLVQSLGLRSLAHLCEADVIDFYTAWDVIAKHIQNYSGNAIVAYGLSLLLRWGALDAEAYPEAATDVLNVLWDIGTHKTVFHSPLWTRAQKAALAALSQYEVVHIKGSIPDFSTRNLEFLISQTNTDLLTALEKFETRMMNYEHITRRRFIKQRRISGSGSKIVKLLDVVPEVIFRSGGNHKIKELPGAALFCLPIHKDVTNQGLSKELQDVHAKYEDAAIEISASLQLSRNFLLALLSLQSWKPFMQRWLRSSIMVLEAKAHCTVLDKTSKAANDILKILTKLAEVAIPRTAENIALALGAFCLVLPASAHAVKSMASKFLLNWLSQYGHEYRQWSAAISLGLISSCLHTTDHKLKFNNINALLEVASISKSTLVKGACGIGMGFSSQDLLTRVYSGANGQSEKEAYQMQETELLKRILGTLVQMICHFEGSSDGILVKLATYFPLGTDDSPSHDIEFLSGDIDHLEEDAWGVAGPIIGLGNSLGALYRAGAHDAVRYLKGLICSWIPNESVLFSKFVVGETHSQILSLGACLVLPTIMSFCHRVELVDDIEFDNLMNGFIELISELLSIERSDTFHQSLLMAACAGAGSLISIVLNAGLHSLVEVEHVKDLLALFRRTYSRPHPAFTHLGGMLGVINAMGAGTGTMIQYFTLPPSPTFDQKEMSRVLGLLSNPALEAEATSLIQEIFLVTQNSDDPQLQQHAAWALSFLRHFVLSREQANEGSAVHNDSHVAKPVSQGFAEDSIVMKLSVWLMQMNYSELGTNINIQRTTAFALRCLSHAPRLPSFDWGAAIRRCMKYGGQAAEIASKDIALKIGTLREECFLFLLSHANQSDSLLGFLDELSDLARFKTLESNLQSLFLLHLADLLKIFSNSRIVKLFDDVADFLHWFVSSDQYNQELKIFLRVSCWKGLQICLSGSALDLETQDYVYNLEHCMDLLFTMLPLSHSDVTVESCKRDSKLEWTEAIRCLGKARQGWLSDLLWISDVNFMEENDQIFRTSKKVQAKAALVRLGSIPLLELANLKAYMLDTNSEVIWNILVEVAVTLHHNNEGVRRQWLVDTVEILCVTSYPSTALRFLGLLCGSSCKYMPLLVADKMSVLSDLPVTLSSLLVGTGWGRVAESVASYICKSTERIHEWARHVKSGDYFPTSQPIHRTENHMADFLLQVMHQTCISLKEYLPMDKQLRLANMVVG